MTADDYPSVAAIDDLDFPFSPHAGRTIADLTHEWRTLAGQLRTYQRQRALVNATTAASDEWLRSRKEWLDEQTSKCRVEMDALEDALTEMRRAKPTDIPQPWTGGAA